MKEKKSYEHRVYESVEDKIVSYALAQNLTKKNLGTNGLKMKGESNKT